MSTKVSSKKIGSKKMTTTIDERFWAKVNRKGPRWKNRGCCWVWTATKIWGGYGHFRANGVLVLAHRWSYEQANGPIPEGLTIDHLCRRRDCVRPSHLEAVTHKINIERGNTGLHNKSKTHCPRNHPYNSDNTFINSNGRRICRSCKRARERKH